MTRFQLWWAIGSNSAGIAAVIMESFFTSLILSHPSLAVNVVAEIIQERREASGAGVAAGEEP
ncbi:MAG: hypothetical protein ABSG53_33100, partial [Thermoguttaceae bacterium]